MIRKGGDQGLCVFCLHPLDPDAIIATTAGGPKNRGAGCPVAKGAEINA